VACWADADASMAFRAAARLGLWLDGSQALAARGGRLSQLAVRLGVKLRDAKSALTDRPHGIWDCGYVPDEPSAWQALAAFAPRRASFIVVQVPAGGDLAAGAPALQALQALMSRRATLACPVRLLVLGTPWPALQAVALTGPDHR